MTQIVNDILTNTKTFFALFFLCIANTACTIPITNPTQTENVQLICDFKNPTPRFYECTNKKMVEKINTGMEEVTPIFNKFIGEKILIINSIQYIEGYFLSINDFNGKIAPNTIGHAYVKFPTDLYCLDVNSLF